MGPSEDEETMLISDINDLFREELDQAVIWQDARSMECLNVPARIILAGDFVTKYRTRVGVDLCRTHVPGTNDGDPMEERTIINISKYGFYIQSGDVRSYDTEDTVLSFGTLDWVRKCLKGTYWSIDKSEEIAAKGYRLLEAGGSL